MRPDPAVVEMQPYEVRAYSPSTGNWTTIITVQAASNTLAVGYARLKQLVPDAITLIATLKPHPGA